MPEITVLSSSTGRVRPNPGASRPPPPPVFHCNEQFGRKRRSDRLKWRLVTRLLGSGRFAAGPTPRPCAPGACTTEGGFEPPFQRIILRVKLGHQIMLAITFSYPSAHVF